MRIWRLVFVLLSLSAVLTLFALFSIKSNVFTVVVCDVGQGDAIFIQQGSYQILVDGGMDSKILDCLGKYMHFWDRQLELVVNTHPQKDHYGGLLNVFESYEVDAMLVSGLGSSSQGYGLLERLVGGGGTRVIYAGDARSMRLGLMHLDILHPTKNYILHNSSQKQSYKERPLSVFESSLDPNFFSVVAVISYENFDILATGDIETEVSDLIAKEIGTKHIEYLKVPHHGSKNGLSSKLLWSIDPDLAVISVGKNNSYGHPNKEILDMLDENGVRTLRTDQLGDVVIESDGNAWWVK